MMYTVEISPVDLVLYDFMTCGSEQNAKNTAPSIPKKLNKLSIML